MRPPDMLVLGVGNSSRGDDAAGLIVARRLQERRLPGVVVRTCAPDGATLLDEWSEAESVVLVDAVVSTSTPGSIIRLDAGAGPIPADSFAVSTHVFGVAQAIELARTLGRLPGRLVVIGIEGASFGLGEGLSPMVEQAVDAAVQAVVDELAAAAREVGEPSG